jgi:hypothetical protein
MFIVLELDSEGVRHVRCAATQTDAAPRRVYLEDAEHVGSREVLDRSDVRR